MKLFSTERTDVHLLDSEYAENLQLYLVNNRTHLAQYEPLRDDKYFALGNIQNRIVDFLNDYQEKRSLLLVVTLKNDKKIIGSINFTNFVYGVFQACYLGFSLDYASQGKGLMYESLDSSIEYVRMNYGIHRIMANHLPDNLRSSNTLRRLGFKKEGHAQSYLKINGVWQDHILNSLVFLD